MNTIGNDESDNKKPDNEISDNEKSNNGNTADDYKDGAVTNNNSKGGKPRAKRPQNGGEKK